MHSPTYRIHRRHDAFTLVELLVSTALIALIMAMLLTTVNQTQGIMQRTTAKVSQFQASRAAFELITRRLSQATLNTYWSAYDPDKTNGSAEYQFRRISELQFLSGPTAAVFGASPRVAGVGVDAAYPTHSVFFSAPLGFTNKPEGTQNLLNYRGLTNLLSTCGYFIEFGDDPQRPGILTTAQPRYRSRLMEITIPSENLMIFQRKAENSDALKRDIAPQVLDESSGDYIGLVGADRKNNAGFKRPLWMKVGLTRDAATQGKAARFTYAHPLAENIIALVILPKKAIKDRSTPDKVGELAPDFAFDSWRILKSKVSSNAARDNLMPPIVQVIMVAIDEPSAIRSSYDLDNPPTWTKDLFVRATTEDALLADLAKLEKKLINDPKKINYRIFSTDVVVRGSKWSTIDP